MAVRVVQLSDYGGPYSGSFIPMLRAVVAASRRRGWSAEAVFTEDSRGRSWVAELEGEGAPVRFVPRERRELARAVAELAAEDDGPLVLHTHFSRFDVPAVRAARRRPGTHVFWHEHSPLSSRPAVVARNVAKFALAGRRVEAILCVAPELVPQLRRRGAPAGKLVFFPNAIDAARFPLADRPARDPRVLLHFGWDWERKGGDLFLEAVARLEGVRAVTVGGGARAQELATRLGIEVETPEPSEDVAARYAEADVFVAPSRAEGMPFSVAEALSTGLPVVASDLPGHRAIGVHVPACRIVPLEPDAIAREIEAVLGRAPGQAAEEASAAHEWVATELDVGAWAERLVALYVDALSSG